jgi:replicative DNA helicase
MLLNIENKILSALSNDAEYTRKVLPFLDKDYFLDSSEAIVFSEIKTFFEKYNALPTKDVLFLSVTDNKSVGEKDFVGCESIINSLVKPDDNHEWLICETEKFCKDRSIHNAIRQAITIIDDKDKTLGKDAIPSLLQKALSVSFDKTVGHDYLDDADARYDFYHSSENKMKFGLSLMNKITGGGLPDKTLSVVVAGTGVGKSIFLCDHAAHCLSVGKNVLYISAELAEERLAERIDANLMNIDLAELKKLSKKDYLNRMKIIQQGTKGKLIFKEYATSTAHAGHFDSLISELKIKKNFVPDVIMVDYLNICLSQRYKAGANVNSYTLIKAVAEELRALAIKHKVPLLSCSQLNREGTDNSNPNLANVSESAGLSHTVDFMFALISTPELEANNQIMIKQLKNRFGDLNYYNKFLIGLRKSRMRMYDLEEGAATENISQHAAVDDDSPFANSKFKGSKNYGSIKV